MGLAVSLHKSTFCSNSGRLNTAIFLKQSWPQIYTLIKYDGGVRGFSGEILNYYCVLQWVFMDILIIAISICLSTRLYELKEQMKQYNRMVVSYSIKLYLFNFNIYTLNPFISEK